MSRTWSMKGAVAIAGGSLFVGLFPAPAGATTYTVTSTSMCGGAGTFEQALEDANANPGTDTITFTPGLVVDANSCTTPAPRPFPFAAFATDSVNIVGNGATIEGNQYYVASNGRVNLPNSCPGNDQTIRAAAITYGFIQIGAFNADNSAVAVNIEGMKFHNLPSLARVEKNASLTMTDSSASEIVDLYAGCDSAAITAESGANVTLTRTQILDSTLPTAGRDEDSTSAVIHGRDGNLALDHVTFGNNIFGRAVTWGGGTAKIVNSLFLDSGGMVLNADNTTMVNSALYEDSLYGRVPGGQGGSNRIVVNRGSALFQASSFYWVDPTCANCTDPGLGFWISGEAAEITFRSSAIGGGADTAGSGPLLIGYNGTGGLSNNFVSDALTWVQPTDNQNVAALAAVLPNAITSPPGLLPNATSSSPFVTVLTPLLGTTSIPGVLLDAVADAQCGGANQLLSPIDSSCITTDVFGKPRVDAGNNKRNIGAVQNAQSPHLAVTSATTNIGLGWNRPPDPVSGAITGYRVTYVPDAGGTPQTVDVTGPDTTSATITGLTLGTPYRFTVAPLNVAGPGTPSNEVLATPLDAVGPPTPTATGGDTAARIFWTEPTLGGRPGPPSYFVMYRPTGTTTWIAGPGPLSARTTNLPELVNGTTYEVGVFATSTDGTPSVLGTTTVTPEGPPAAPGLTATPGGPGTGQIALTWTRPDDGGSPITSYQVRCRATGSSSWTAHPASGLGTSLTVTELQPGTPYECEVAAVNANGAGPWSAQAEATPPAAVTPTPDPSPTTTDPSPTITDPSPTTTDPSPTITDPSPATTASSGGPMALTGFEGLLLALAAVLLLGGTLAVVTTTRRRA